MEYANSTTDGQARRGHIVGLDGLRGISVLFVLAVHGTYGRLGGGFLGVDIFFVISGYLITTLLIREWTKTGGINIRSFYARRACRILPPLFVCVLLAVALEFSKSGFRVSVILSVFGFYANYLEAEKLGNLAHVWSLSIEEQFYAVWPLLFLALSTRRIVLLTFALIAVAVLVRFLMVIDGSDLNAIYSFTFSRMDSLLVGCALALLSGKALSWISAMPQWFNGFLANSIFAGLFVCLVVGSRDYFQSVVPAFTLFAMLVAALIVLVQTLPAENLSNRILLSKPLIYTGRRSYSLYLYHYPIFIALEGLRTPGDFTNYVWVLMLKLILSFLATQLSWTLLEVPFVRLKNRMFSTAKSDDNGTMLKANLR